MKPCLVHLAVALTLAAAAAALAQSNGDAMARDTFKAAFDLGSMGLHGAAAAKYREGLARDPRNADAHFFLAESLVGMGDLDNAKRHYESAAAYGAGTPNGQAARAKLASWAAVANGAQASRASELRDVERAQQEAAAIAQKRAELQSAAATEREARRKEAEEKATIAKRMRPIKVELAASALSMLRYYDGSARVRRTLGKSVDPEYEKSAMFRLAVAEYQKRMGMSADGQLTDATIESLLETRKTVLRWSSQCFRTEVLLEASYEDSIVASTIYGLAMNAKAGCAKDWRLVGSSCQVCSAPPPLMHMAADYSFLYTDP